MDLIGETRRNWNEHGLGQLDAMIAATSVARGHQIILGRINAALANFSLTFSRYEALALLNFTRDGSMRLARMGERLQVHPTSVTSTIDRLERDRLVTRTPHPDDRRAILATITPKGRKVLDAATIALEDVDWGMGGLDPAALTDLINGMAQVRETAGDDVSQSLPTTSRTRSNK